MSGTRLTDLSSLHRSGCAAHKLRIVEKHSSVPTQYQTLLLDSPEDCFTPLKGHESLQDRLALRSTVFLVQQTPRDAARDWREAWDIQLTPPFNSDVEHEDWFDLRKQVPSVTVIRYLLRFIDPKATVTAYSHNGSPGCHYTLCGPALVVALKYGSLDACRALLEDERVDVNGEHGYLVDCFCSSQNGDIENPVLAFIGLIQLCEKFGRYDVCKVLCESGQLSDSTRARAQELCIRRGSEDVRGNLWQYGEWSTRGYEIWVEAWEQIAKREQQMDALEQNTEREEQVDAPVELLVLTPAALLDIDKVELLREKAFTTGRRHAKVASKRLRKQSKYTWS